ncbi:unnamed protein product [Brugia pahangi]|uniref:Uncharacterized protein n=1 Tax=Brugia pahangi TaxID=6280 RepID=A0A0N4TLJ7_BRUPA|nr:unnamed protein product [Brugia pahangi]
MTSGQLPITSPFTFPSSVSSIPTERFKFFIPPSYIFPPPFPPHYFSSAFFRPIQFPHFNTLNDRKLFIFIFISLSLSLSLSLSFLPPSFCKLNFFKIQYQM